MPAPTYLSRSAVLDGFGDVARQCGFDPQRMLADHACPPGCLDNPDLKLPTATVLRLLEDAARLGREPSFGLRMAEYRGPSTNGAVGLVMREQPDVRSAFASLSRHGWSQIDGIDLAIEEQGAMAMLSLTLAPGLGASAPQALELTLAALVRMLRWLIGPEWVPEMVVFRHPRPGGNAVHLRMFGVAPLFGMDHDALIVRAADLDRPIAGAHPATARQLERYLAFVAGTRSVSEAGRVRRVIASLLPRGQCRIERVAGQMGVDRRTLHRRLAAEGTSFTRLVGEVRAELLEGHLAQGRTRTEIADLLGFSCLSAFSRWNRIRLEPAGKPAVEPADDHPNQDLA